LGKGEDALIKNCELLKLFVIREETQIGALQELQSFCYINKAPKGVFEKWLQLMIDNRLVKKRAVLSWADDREDTTPGKSELTNQASKILHGLKTTKSQSDEEEEGNY